MKIIVHVLETLLSVANFGTFQPIYKKNIIFFYGVPVHVLIGTSFQCIHQQR